MLVDVQCLPTLPATGQSKISQSEAELANLCSMIVIGRERVIVDWPAIKARAVDHSDPMAD